MNASLLSGEITHWQIHVNIDYKGFLDFAIDEHWPYKNGAGPYMKAVTNKLISDGIDIQQLLIKRNKVFKNLFI